MKCLLTILISILLSATAGARERYTHVLDPYIFGDSLELARNYSYADSLKRVRNSTLPSAERVKASHSLGDYYKEHYIDSAFMYWNMARDEAVALGLEREALILRMQIDANMPFIGMGAEGYTDFSRINSTSFDSNLKRLYFLASSELYYNLAMNYPESAQKNRTIAKAVESIDSLMRHYPADTPVYRYLYAFRNHMTGNRTIAAATMAELLPELENRPALYVQGSRILADFYADNPDRRKDYMAYLTDAVMTSLRNGVIRPALLARLGRELCLDGDTKRGARCIYLAMTSPDSEECLYSLRDVAIYAPMLSGADTHSLMIRNIVSATLLLIIAALAIFLIAGRRTARRREKIYEEIIRKESENSAHLRTERSNYLSLAFVALENLKEFNRYAHRKLTANQAKTLFKDLEHGTFVQSLSERFFEEFDAMFLKSEPEFIERLNSLLRSDQHLELLQPGNRLSPELRIAALMSMGITDSSRIASVLGLSLNTVYTYRNRLKGRAVTRADFENQISKISD